jgi:hypothetical protein
MFRRCLCLGGGILALVVVLWAPGRVQAQFRGGGPRPGGMHTGFRPWFNSGFRSGSMPRSAFDTRFNGRFSNPRFGTGRFDRFENRFGSGRFDRFEDRFERRFNGFVDPRFMPGFTTGFFPPL